MIFVIYFDIYLDIGDIIMMLHIRIDDALAKNLKYIAQKNERTQTYYVRKLLEEFVEDELAYQEAVKAKMRMKKTGEKPIPYEDIVAELNLPQDDEDE